MGEQTGDVGAPCIRIVSADEIPAVLDRAGVDRDRAVIVLVGGASGMSADDLDTVVGVLRDEVVPVAERWGAVVIDGGTDSGVMRLMGRARSASGSRFPLVGVAAAGTVSERPTDATPSRATALEPNHTLVLLVPGTRWGDEAPWITEVACIAAGSRPSVTLLVNGGQISYVDVARSIESGRPVVVLAGSGRTADAIAEARAGRGGDDRAVEIAASPLTRVVEVADTGAVAAALEEALDGG